MSKNNFLENKPQFSGHETFPLRQLWLKKAYNEVSKCTNPKLSRGIFSDERAIVRFGVGKNMVSAIRHWALACNIVEEHPEHGYKTTDLGDQLFCKNGLDEFQENLTTNWLIHWKLAGEGNRSTTWKWLFNYVNESSLDSDHLISSLQKFAIDNNFKVANATLKKDLECCLRSYVPRVAGDSPEEISDSVLGELALIHRTGRGVFEFRRGAKQTLNDSLFVYCLLRFWANYAPSNQTLSFESIAHEFGSPGRVFKLDETSVIERVQSLDDITKGQLIWSDTAGMKQIIRTELIIKEELFLAQAYE